MSHQLILQSTALDVSFALLVACWKVMCPSRRVFLCYSRPGKRYNRGGVYVRNQ